MKKINFILNGSAAKPVGGFKIVYEYANYLTQNGFEVIVTQALISDKKRTLYNKLKLFYGFFREVFNKNYLPTAWFDLDPRVKIKWVPSLNEIFIEKADFIVACPYESTEFVVSYSHDKGEKYYFIQGYENWDGKSHARIAKTWKMPFRKIVISKFLQEQLSFLNEVSFTVPNGLDFKKFNLDNGIEGREKGLLFLFHELEMKGSAEILQAFSILNSKFPYLPMTCFSTFKKPDNFPGFIEFIELPSQQMLRELYNKNSIFITASWSEGFSLPPAESMQCGCTVVATDIGAHHEFIIDNETGLFCSVKDSHSIVEKISYLLENNEERIRIAKKGNNYIQQFKWDNSVSLFVKALNEWSALEKT